MLGHLSEPQIEELLQTELVGRIGCHAAGETYVVPVTYLYEEGCIWGHTGEGLKLRLLRQNPQVCFEVDHMDNLANWRSVIVQGHFDELHGEEAHKAMDRLTNRLEPLLASETSTPSRGAALRADTPDTHRADPARYRPVVYRITIEKKTGRFEKRP